MIYLDHNATTPLDAAALDAMMPYLRQVHGNASSVHRAGQAARRAIDTARQQVAALVGADPGDVTFTSGGTEADNLALFGVLTGDLGRWRRKLIVSAIEHPAVLAAAQALAERGFELVELPVDARGVVAPEALAERIDGETALVSVMLANNDVGTLQPVAELAAIAHGAGALFHCDAVQAAGKVAVDVAALGVDLLTLSSHKIYGPKGVGALVAPRALRLAPLLHGGGQELRRRAGTENVAGIVGFGAAAALAAERLAAGEGERLRAQRDRFEALLRQRVPAPLRVAGADAPRLPNTTSVILPGAPGDALLMNLDLAGICASVGSACASGKRDPSHVLLAMGVSPDDALATLRFSSGRQTSAGELEATVVALADAVPRVRTAAAEAAS